VGEGLGSNPIVDIHFAPIRILSMMAGSGTQKGMRRVGLRFAGLKPYGPLGREGPAPINNTNVRGKKPQRGNNHGSLRMFSGLSFLRFRFGREIPEVSRTVLTTNPSGVDSSPFEKLDFLKHNRDLVPGGREASRRGIRFPGRIGTIFHATSPSVPLDHCGCPRFQ
jgi:hypothetical protein